MTLPDWSRAHGKPLFPARLRAEPADFNVTEELGYDFDGSGEHDYLFLEKTGTNTEWLSRQLARFADVPARDVGYSGLKDRNAVTCQWFSVPRWHQPDWSVLDIEGARLLDQQRHSKKLRRGVHKANHFRIILRPDESGSDPFPGKGSDPFATRLREIREQGVPNYFGEQRFGREGANLGLADAWARGKRLPRHKRSLAISSVRSFVFNEYLQARVVDDTWNRLCPGDFANLDGSGSIFPVAEPDAELLARIESMDLHPAAELAGEGSGVANPLWQSALDRARVKPGSRSLRLAVRDLNAEFDEDCIVLCFSLGKGAFATAVLREIVSY